MKTIACFFLNMLIFSTICLGQTDRNLEREKAGAIQSEKRIALVIGNGAYTAAPPLKNPTNDARDMAATLKALGFEVTIGTNVNQRDFKRLIREFGQKLKAGGSGLFYYAGHGVQSKGRNYLVPVDADIASEAEVEDSGVDISLVLNFMDEAQNGVNIVILDACRNNPFARSFRSASDGLAQVDAPTGTLIAYATAPGTVASDGADQNGLYTSELLKQMRVPGQSATDAFMRVRAEVMKQTGKKQVPWEASSLVGAFYFGVKPKGGPGISASENKLDTSAFELSFWETIKNSTNADDFKSYLQKYPNGQFADLANIRAAGLGSSVKPANPTSASRTNSTAELVFWDSIKSSTNIDDYKAYIRKYPNGEFVELATGRLQPLETALKNKEKEDTAKLAADELAKQTKSFKGLMGLKMWAGSFFNAGTLNVSSAKIQFVYDGDKSVKAGTSVQLDCQMFAPAIVEGPSIRGMENGTKYKNQINMSSASDATNALQAIKSVCSQEKPPTF